MVVEKGVKYVQGKYFLGGGFHVNYFRYWRPKKTYLVFQSRLFGLYVFFELFRK